MEQAAEKIAIQRAARTKVRTADQGLNGTAEAVPLQKRREVEEEVVALGLKPSLTSTVLRHPTKRKDGASRGPRLPGLWITCHLTHHSAFGCVVG